MASLVYEREIGVVDVPVGSSSFSLPFTFHEPLELFWVTYVSNVET